MRSRAAAMTLLMITQLVAFAPPAKAAGFIVFVCDGSLPEWPAVVGSGSPCTGVVTGADLPAGPVCVPVCAFMANVRFYEEPCVPPYPIPVRGHWVIDMNVNGTFLGEYDVERTGNHVDYFSRSGPVRVGVGEWLPRSTLIGTCATSLPLDYTLTGRIVLT